MPTIFLTPASISFLTQLILALSITAFLLNRLRSQRTRQLILLVAFFALISLFIGLMFLDAALSPYYRLWAVYAENTVLALALVFLIQFAYYFPRQYRQHRWEARAALIVSLAYLSWEVREMLYRYTALFDAGIVNFRPDYAAYLTAVVLVWVPVAFLRQCIAADARPIWWGRKLAQPAGRGARGARTFVFVFAIPFVLGLIDLLRVFTLPTSIYNAALAVGILVALWLFAHHYTNFIPGGASVQVKIAVISLTIFLALLGSAGWMIAPPYIATFEPNLTDLQTLRFTPNAAGSYAVEEVDFWFETELGARIPLGVSEAARYHKVAFAFPFFGRTFSELYIVNAGAITLGEPYWHPNLQAETAQIAAIFPLLIDLDPRPAADAGAGARGVYYRQDADRLVITWYQLPALYRREAAFTFQAVLHANGVFEFTYNGLPLPFTFDPDTSPAANPWLRGAVSGQGEPFHNQDRDLITASKRDDAPLIENFQLAFRRHLHELMLPLAYVLVGGSLVLLLGLPLLLRFSIVRPLETLAEGVQQMEAGDLTVELPVQNEDEIGYLTGAFNHMAARLAELVSDLEIRVAERTTDLTTANQSLQAEMKALAEAQLQILEQGQELAALEERTRLSRELHDGLGQVLSYIIIQSGAVRSLLQKKELAAAQTNLAQLIAAAREAATDLRVHLLDLRSNGDPVSEPEQADLCETLATYLVKFQERYGLEIHFWSPENCAPPLFPPHVEDQVLRIIQEALANVVKHAQAERADIDFQVSEREVQVSISDNGIGFELAASKPSPVPGHYGLKIMQERAGEIGGRLEIRARPGKGTRVRLCVPRFLQAADEDDLVELRGLRIVLADDHPLFLSGLRSLLTARGLTVVGTAENGQEAFEKVRTLQPDMALLDLNMPKWDGIAATRAIKAELPAVKVVILTIPDAEDQLYEAIRAGASGYLHKDLDPNQLCRLLTGLMRGEAALSPGIAERMMADFARGERAAAQGTQPAPGETAAQILTPRQQEILQMVADGLIYKEVGAALGISEKTIKYHMGQIIEHLNVENRAQAIALYHQQQGE